jgi:hypothetical protein
MTVDYRLLPTWEASQHRHQHERRALPGRKQSNGISNARVASESRVRLHLHASEREGPSLVRLPLDDR